MTKSQLLTAIILTIFTGVSYAQPSQSTCNDLISVGLGKEPPPAVLLKQYKSNIKACLASCNTLYGPISNANSYQHVTTCHSSLQTLDYMADYQTQLAQLNQNGDTQSDVGMSSSPGTAPSSNKQNDTNQSTLPTTPSTPPKQQKKEQNNVRWF